jgi:hypothetical protein
MVLPAQPAVMVLGGLAVMLGLVYPPLGQAVAYLAWPFTAYTIRSVELLAGLPGGVLVLGPVEMVWIVVYYMILISLALAGPRLKEWYLARGGARIEVPVAVPVLAMTVLGVMAVFVWRSALAAPDGRLHLTVLDVGTGDAVLVQTLGGRNLLIDGGEPEPALGRPGSSPADRRRQLDWLLVAATGMARWALCPGLSSASPRKTCCGRDLWKGAAWDTCARPWRKASFPLRPRKPARPSIWAMAPGCVCWRLGAAAWCCCVNGEDFAHCCRSGSISTCWKPCKMTRIWAK